MPNSASLEEAVADLRHQSHAAARPLQTPRCQQMLKLSSGAPAARVAHCHCILYLLPLGIYGHTLLPSASVGV